MAEAELSEVVKQLATVRFTSPGAGDALQSGGKQRGAVLMECVTHHTYVYKITVVENNTS